MNGEKEGDRMLRPTVFMQVAVLLLTFSGCATLPEDFERPPSLP
jgi:hypothetical protein